MVHIVAHFIVPAIAARLGYGDRWRTAYLAMMATMMVDLDHLLADPIYDPGRCSIGFHPLHGVLPIAVYCGLIAVPKLRVFGIGLLLHMLLDALDCASM
jgi:Family of unknown function (DUF6122)